MTTANFETAEKITAFLTEQTGSVLKAWSGRMPKAQQLEIFGYYFGKGRIYLDPEREVVAHIVKVCFGTDSEYTAQMKFTGEFIYNNRR